MAVLIEGMSFAPYNDEGFFNLRVFDGRPQAQYNDGYGNYTEWYDMIIVPEPHGRLIDASETVSVQMYDEEHEDWFMEEMTIDDLLGQGWIDAEAPTIIPADKLKQEVES